MMLTHFLLLILSSFASLCTLEVQRALLVDMACGLMSNSFNEHLVRRTKK